jgi:hypothetical protein
MRSAFGSYSWSLNATPTFFSASVAGVDFVIRCASDTVQSGFGSENQTGELVLKYW